MPASGLDAFIAYLSEQAGAAPGGFAGSAWYMLRIGEDCAFICLQDLWQPGRFLRQMAGSPPLCFSTDGFNAKLVDDPNPARHYIAFVFVGFWLPRLPALAVLYAWEVAGFLRYGLQWSSKDVECGLAGLRHGALVRQYGPTILPSLTAAEFCDSPAAILPATPSKPAAASPQ